MRIAHFSFLCSEDVVRHLCMLGDRLGCLYDIVLVRGDRLDSGR
jgi:hypothetical protein